jgi:hypothetical protein
LVLTLTRGRDAFSTRSATYIVAAAAISIVVRAAYPILHDRCRDIALHLSEFAAIKF